MGVKLGLSAWRRIQVVGVYYRLLGRICGRAREVVRGYGESSMMIGLTACTPHELLLDGGEKGPEKMGDVPCLGELRNRK
jgi:hypothetical protein